MTDSNRVRLAVVREASLGVTPATPRMRRARFTGESLRYTPRFVTAEDIRDDRMNSDPVKVNETNDGGTNHQFHYPVPGSYLSEFLASVMFADWVNAPFRDNDGVADSQITDIGTTAGTVAVAGGPGFAAGHLVRHTGFANAANNGLFPVTTGGTTSYVSTGAAFVAEAAPPAAARVKVVGFQGAAGDIKATATGLTSTALNFTTLGLQVGQWIKIGGTGAAFRFGTAGLNDWARIAAIDANALTLDNLPAGWGADTGASKTIRCFFGDTVKNGTAMISLSMERSFLGQAIPTHILQRGMVAGQVEFGFQSEQIVTANFQFMGLSGSQGTVPAAASYEAAPAQVGLSANVSVGRVAESGAALAAPNWVRAATISLNNNLRTKTAVGTVGAVDIGAGEAAVTGSIETYFGSNALLAKLLNGTAGAINLRAAAASQAVIWQLPRVTFTEGAPNAGAKNQDVVMSISFQGSIDAATNAVLLLDRLEYYEV